MIIMNDTDQFEDADHVNKLSRMIKNDWTRLEKNGISAHTA